MRAAVKSHCPIGKALISNMFYPVIRFRTDINAREEGWGEIKKKIADKGQLVGTECERQLLPPPFLAWLPLADRAP